MTYTPKNNKYRILSMIKRDRVRGKRRHSLIIIIFVCFLYTTDSYGQNIAIKSNLLYDITSTLNLGGEIRCDDTHTFNLSINYNPWSFGSNKKMKHFLIQPEYRKWLNGIFMGHFIGLQAHYAQYNFGGMLPWGFRNGKMFGIENKQIRDNRYQGNLVGFGVSYGYQWILSAQWNLEASAALGYAHLSYKRYGQAENAALIEKSHSNYWGPTQVGISLVYFIR